MQNQSNTEQFLKLPYDLLAATSFVSSTGEIVEITLQQKIIYCWMKQRCEFFTREKKEYFDNLDSVANELTINRKTVMDAIKLFTKHNILFAEKRKAAGAREKWFFKRFNNLVLASGSKPAQKASVSLQVERSHSTDTNVAPAVKQPSKPSEEVVKDDEDFDSMIEIASDDYNSYSEQVEQKLVCPFATAPSKRFKPNGSVSEEMEFWCNKNQVSITNVDGQTVFKYKAKRFIIDAGAFVEYVAPPYVSSAPKTLAEASGMPHMLQSYLNDEEPVPF
ncbi:MULTISPECIES: DUF6945 domain-containing protein [unclassified Pseudomonas]|uniref:DUF6945 domain-containing protein n=1 Tax=unclassified Pseudomonas TaxID=196821 RepID=UPI002360817C|nr:MULTISPECIES: hypothetical protein [unclassified Pseudomonas]